MKKIIYSIALSAFAIGTIMFLVSGRETNENDKDLFEISKNIRLMTNVYDQLNTFYVDEPNPGELMKEGIDAMLKSLDPYTVYIPESKIEDYRYMTTGQYGGIGSLIQAHGDYIVISEPYKNSPTVKAGLKAGDKILEVDGKSVIGKTTNEMSMFLKGGAGTELTIKYDRNGTIGEVTFAREEIKVPAVPYYGMLDQKTGYVKLNSFTQTASSEVGKALKALKDSSDMQQLVFDLRGNGGGLLNEAVNIVNFFIPRNQLVVSTKGRLKEVNKEYKTRNAPFDLEIPVVVLIDGGSASASEIVSGSLQDLDRAVVLGHRSYGKGLVQQTKKIEFGSMVKLTVAKYYTPSGRCIQKLDYSHKNDQGKAVEVADSLIATFKTKSGRIVKDGRGVDPDVKMPEEFYSNLTASLMKNHFIFDYATQYEVNNEASSPAKTFSLTDQEISDFQNKILSEGLDYTSKADDELQKLVKALEKENLNELTQQEIDNITEKIKPNLERDLELNEDEYVKILENEVVSRYYYSKGRVEHALQHDEFVAKAIEVLNDQSQYSKILSTP